MRHVITSVFAIVSLIASTSSNAFSDSSVNVNDHGITVYSVGEVHAEPDVARLFFRVKSEKRATATEASEECIQKAKNTLTTIRGAFSFKVHSIDDTAVRLTYLPGKLDQAAASWMAHKDLCLSITNNSGISGGIRDHVLDRIAAIQDRMGALDAIPIGPLSYGQRLSTEIIQSWIHVENVEWAVLNTRALENDAIKVALKNARDKAKQIAERIDTGIGPIHSIQYIDDVDKMRHVWNALSPVQIGETVRAKDTIIYRVALVVHYEM